MTSALGSMDLCEQFAALSLGNAPHEDTVGATAVEIPFYHRVAFSQTDYALSGHIVISGHKLPASAIHYVQLLAAVAVVGIGVAVVIDALQLSSGGLVPQLLPDCGPAVRGLLLAGPLARRG